MSENGYTAHTRLFVDLPLGQGQVITLSDDQRHYLSNVMRFKLGGELRVFNGVDGEWSATISELSKKTLKLDIAAQTREQTTLPDVWYVFAPIKKARIDFIVQKATELGATALVPVFTRHTVAGRVNEKRMLANAIEAAEQSERLCVPEIHAPQKLDKLIANWPSERALMFCDENLSGKSVNESLAGGDKNIPWAVLIGPEGGFEQSERAMIKKLSNVTTVSLGPRILRADTAGLAALALWQSQIGDW
ncbi:MAG: 16S rRNA (uracil(1498)-N(3))-methyltransferase [Sphingomonadales bacterium]|nr:16S rRNA (uracil(1498)-N(3))-methyltransferase [Sphingomonadales bacterium]